MVVDVIADMLTRIRNAYLVNNDSVNIPYSKVKERILDIFKKFNYIENFEIKEVRKGIKDVKVILKDMSKEGYKYSFKRVSKPGRRIYSKAQDIKKVRDGLGIAVISTSRGFMTGGEAYKNNLGGEIICEVY